MKEVLTWQIFDNPPKHQDGILIQLGDGKVDAGYYRNDKYYFVGDDVECNVVWWAEWPKGVEE